jgi:peptide chain release factor 1
MMSISAKLQQKLLEIEQRHQELQGLLSSQELLNDHQLLQKYAKENTRLEPISHMFQRYNKTVQDLKDCELMAQDSDAALKTMAQEEIKALKSKIVQLEESLLDSLTPVDPEDECNVFLEIRAGTGGNEAAIFVGDLFRMYQRFAEDKKWALSTISAHASEQGGFKVIIARVVGAKVYAQLKFESGVHRVQRIPVTESQGRIHTSACTVAILPEVEVIDEVSLDASELRIDTFRSSGAGGQHVNTTDSAVRITHLPTGIVSECQDERSQHKNKAKAMQLLSSKIVAQERANQHQAQSEQRKSLVGSGDRSERIRTYNFPQGRISDHRINQTWYQLQEILSGNLEPVVTALQQAYHVEQRLRLQETS